MKGKKPEPIPPTATDVRDPGEKALAEAQASYFNRLMGQPNLGYQDITAAEDPIY